MAKGLLSSLLDEIFDKDWKGRRGEKLTQRELRIVDFFGREGKILRNVYIPTYNGQTTEIDVLYITQKGIFVIESKNYSGWVFGDEIGKYWTVCLPNGEKHKLYNPIMQNRTHIKWLGKFIGERIPLFSIIVFSERCELKKVPENNTTLKIVERDRLYAAVRDIWDASEDVLKDSEVCELFEKLDKMTNVDAVTKTAHIENIQHQTQEKQEIVKNSDNGSLICPRCGKRLVLRTAKQGAYAGKQFYGCSGYPKCRFTMNV